MAELQRNFHILHRCGNVGNELLPKGVNTMMANERSGTLLPPGVNAGDNCPAGGQCDICPISDKCVKLHELRTYADEHEMLLPAFLNVNRSPRAATGSDDEGLYPPGVS